jgi:hypothetical protein
MVKVDVLENWGRESAMRKKWLKIWDKVGARILQFPKWMQVIILQDINTAIENRVAIMEIIQNAKRNH